MSVFKCKMCGGALEVQNGESVAVCEYCGTKQTLPKLDNDRKANLYDRANHFRRNNEFDKAMGIYEQILNDDNTDAEAYWSIVLCRYGIEYVEDPASHKRVPTVNRAQFTSVFADEDYKSAIEHADGAQREIYEHEAKTIDEIQKGILAISQKEEPFDVFICYKETDANGRRTPDSVLATDLYHQLKQEGFKVFFSRITLEDKLGTAYEPYIFAALNSAKVMVVLGTKPEYFNAVWVKNEWSRYLALIKNGAQKVLVPAYKDMDPYDLPEEFSHLQAQDMGKLGFMQDLIRGIKKLAATEEPKATVKETVIVNNGNASNVNTASLLKRAFMFLEDEEWESADEYCEKVLDIDPENAEAYLGKLMAELRVSNKEDLSNCEYPFDGMNNYKKVLRFCDEKLHKELQEYNVIIRKRNIREYEEKHYADACELMRDAETEEEFKEAAESFEEIIDFSDAKEKKEKCLELAETARKQAIYDDAYSFKNQQTINGYEEAVLRFEQIFGFKDAEEQVAVCRRKAEELKIEAEKKAEAERIAAEAQKKKNKKIAAIVTTIVALAIASAIIFIPVIQAMMNYNAAVALMENGQYEEAIVAFEATDGYKDSIEKVDICYLAMMGEINYNRWKNTEIGDSFTFGNYHGESEWLVLDKQGTRFLIISKNAIDNMPYTSDYGTVTWQNSFLRQWLNNYFIKTAFNKEERKMIVTTEVFNYGNPDYGTTGGKNTEDKVFLLSIEEAEKYFSFDEERQCEPSAYAEEQEVSLSSNGKCCWWLRSPGAQNKNVTYVTCNGEVDKHGIDASPYGDGSRVHSKSYAVRPAMWIDLSAIE